MNILEFGLVRAFRGFRTGDPQLVIVGIVALVYVWLRRRRGSRRLLVSKTLRAGEGVRIELPIEA
jgi:hypothetical protein